MRPLVPQKQRISHNPDEGKFGDCYRTCVAVVLGMEAELVPHVYDNGGDGGIEAMRDWLGQKGLGISQSVYNGELRWSAFCDWMEQFNPNVPIITTGHSPRGVNHCVVMIGGTVVCDPHSGDHATEPFVGPAKGDGEENWWVETITEIATTKPSE